MKTAISLPDDLFRLAETAARKLRMSRSQLYATAVAEFLERRQAGKNTKRLSVCPREPLNYPKTLLSMYLSFLPLTVHF